MATSGLCAEARERIAEEIASHYDEALNEARGEGFDEPAATVKAVHSLGNPRRARRRLRREHLTRWQRVATDQLLLESALRNRSLTAPKFSAKMKWFIATIFGYPFILIAVFLVLMGFIAGDTRSTLTAALPALGIVGLVIAIPLCAYFVTRVERSQANGIPLWRLALRRYRVNAAWALFGFVLTCGIVWSDIAHLRSMRESDAKLATANREFDDWTVEEIDNLIRAAPPSEHEWLREWKQNVEQPPSPTPEPLGFNGFMLWDIVAYTLFDAMFIATAIFYARLARKLRRLGYTDPPSAMA